MKTETLVSAITAVLFALAAYIILQFLEIPNALLFGIICGVATYSVLFPFLVIYLKRLNKKYADFEKELTSPVFCKINGNFNLGNGKIKNGNVYFCESGIVCVCLDEKPYTLDEILLQDIDRYQFDDIHLNIFAKDGRMFVITSPDVKKAIDALIEKDRVEFR